MNTPTQLTGFNYAGTVFTNQRVALQGDLVFEWVVNAETGWLPVSELELKDLKVVQRAMDNCTIFPEAAHEYVRKQIVDKTRVANSIIS